MYMVYNRESPAVMRGFYFYEADCSAYGIACCVTHLGVRSDDEHVKSECLE